jgi:peptidoglycan/LPS O-acetylase OafA/YrhL
MPAMKATLTSVSPWPSHCDSPQSCHDRFRQVRFFACLDGLRGLSILAVIWHHTLSPSMPANWPLVHEGNRGVHLFFAISAFLISTLLLRGQAAGSLHVPTFWARRALRIFPLYFLVLLTYVGTVFLFEHDAIVRQTFFSNLKYFATFTSNWFVSNDSSRVIFYFAWSLAAEEQFYLCWPWVERFLPSWGAVILSLLLIAGAQSVLIVYAGESGMPLPAKILTGIPFAILLGVTIAHALHSPLVYRQVFRLAGRRGAALTTVVCMLIVLGLEPKLGAFRELAVGAVMTLVVLTCVIREDNDLAALLRWRPLAWIGVVSYGIYLLHMLSVHVFHGLANALLHSSSAWLDFAGATAVSIAAASVSYLTYERYFLAMKDRWFGTSVNVRHPAPPTLAASVRESLATVSSRAIAGGR